MTTQTVPGFPTCSAGATGARLGRLVLAAAGSWLLSAHTANAEEAAGEAKLEEVMVTATRTGAQNVQNIPVAVTVISTDALDRLGLGSLSDFENLVPSLSVQELGPGQNKIAIRGISDPGNVDPTNLEDQSLVAVYLDDTPISLQGATPDLKVFDLERVEVLRGPQGTLYGAGSMAGTIRFISRKPDPNSTFGYVEAVGSNTADGSGNYNVRGSFNTPLVTQKVGVSLSAYQGHDSGYIDNVGYGRTNANSVNTTQVRGAVRYLPSSNLTVDFSVVYSNLKADGNNSAYAGLGNGHSEYSSLTPESYRDRLTLYNLTVAYNLGFADLTSSSSFADRNFDIDTSYQVMDEALVFGTPTPAPNFITNRIHDFTQEIRLNSKGSGPFKWIAGVFYDTSTRHYVQNNLTPGLDDLIGVSSIEYNAPVENDLFYGDEHLRQRQFALFGEGTYTVADRLDLTAGARYFDYSQTYGLYYGGLAGSLAPGQPLIQVGTGKESGVNPRAVVTYHVSSDMIVFAEAAKGFRYGGVNQPVPASFCGAALAGQGLSSAPLTFGPDKLWSYSIGEKSTLGGGRATLNATAFFIDWKDLQTNDTLPCGYYFTQNAGRVTSKGVELESTTRVTQQLTVTASASYTNAQSAQAIPNLSAGKGDPVPYFPQYIAAASGQYRIPIGSAQNLTFELNAQYRSSTYNNFSPLERVQIPGSTVLNSGLTFTRDNWEVGVFGHNLTNEHVVTAADINTFGPLQPGDIRYYARPRTLGLRVRLSF
jgi:iron complex outermembrane receptor protein